MPATMSDLMVVDGPACPNCLCCSWRVRLVAEPGVETVDRLEVQLRIVEIQCTNCDGLVPIDEDDDVSDGMHWRPDPSDEPLWDLP